jgi:sec-independent protein translocase protein TatB
MFDFAWSEIGVIAVAALIFIGPKDMPVAIKAVSGAIKKARRMAAEFQTHVDDLVREADLQEVRDHIGDLRNFNLGRTVEKLVDEDGSIRRSFDDPFATTSLGAQSAPAPLDQAFVAVAERPEIGTEIEPASSAPVTEIVPEPTISVEQPDPMPLTVAPAFIPPAYVAASAPAGPAKEPPPFIPPAFARAGSPPSLSA